MTWTLTTVLAAISCTYVVPEYSYPVSSMAKVEYTTVRPWVNLGLWCLMPFNNISVISVVVSPTTYAISAYHH
jgi:hypothetical protein